MEQNYGSGLDGIGDEIAIPECAGGRAGHDPQHGDDRERECHGDEERHAVLAVELVDNHQHIDIAERNEAQGEDAQGAAALSYDGLVSGSEEVCYGRREYEREQADDGHGHGDEAERLAQHEAERLAIARASLNSTERLQRAAGACHEKVVDLQQVHTHGEDEDAVAPEGAEHDAVGGEEQHGETHGCQCQRRSLRDDVESLRRIVAEREAQVAVGAPVVVEHDSYAHQMTYDGRCRGACNTPSAQLNEDEVEPKVHGIVDDDGQRCQTRTAIGADHDADAPHHHVGWSTIEHRAQVLERRLQQVGVVAEQRSDGHGRHEPYDREDETDDEIANDGVCVDVACSFEVFLANGKPYEHTTAGSKEQTQRHHQLHYGFRQVDSADAVGPYELTYDDAVDDVAEASRECDENARPQISPKEGRQFLLFLVVHCREG